MNDKYNEVELTEEDFYPPQDNRVLKSYIEDIDEENNFVEFTKYIFDLYEEEEWNEDWVY